MSEADSAGVMTAAGAGGEGNSEPTTHVVLTQSPQDALTKFLLYTTPNTSIDRIVRDVDDFLPIDLITQVFPQTQGEVPKRITFQQRAQRWTSPFDILWRGNSGISKRILDNGRNNLLKAKDCGALKVMRFLKDMSLWPAISDTPAAAEALFEKHFSKQFAACTIFWFSSVLDIKWIFDQQPESDHQKWLCYIYTFLLGIHFEYEQKKGPIERKIKEVKPGKPSTESIYSPTSWCLPMKASSTVFGMMPAPNTP
jgi:hypothetical protein